LIVLYLNGIDKIDDIEVNATITINCPGCSPRMSFRINDKYYGNIRFIKDSRENPNNPIKVKEFIMTVSNLVKTLKFDKLFGKFIDDDDDTKEMFEYDMKLFEGSTNIVFNCKECPCCLEPTISKTICNHSLCFPCFQKIKNTYCDGDCLHDECNGGHKLCPLCKEIL
jgi:hypothetical protein